MSAKDSWMLNRIFCVSDSKEMSFCMEVWMVKTAVMQHFDKIPK